jgi:DNA-binding NarL/FixJ family response regulator
MTSLEPSRIVLVEDHSLFAESLEMALHLEGFEASRLVLDPEMCGARLLAGILRMRPRTVLLDLDLGAHGNGLALVGPLAAARISVIVVTSTTDRARWGECLAHGARRVVAKHAPLSEIIVTVRRLANGLPMMPPAERQELIECWRQRVAAEQDILARLRRLTLREAEVLGLLMSGKQVGEIARQRFVSESTVRTQVKAILAKLQVGSQLTAVGLAHRASWLPPSEPALRSGPTSTTPSIPRQRVRSLLPTAAPPDIPPR